jgi:threonine/homoserine/homoserine lactone efflux protein
MEFIFLAIAHFIALISPGPDFFLIVQVSIRMPLRYALAVCCGITVANAIYLMFAVLGLEIIKDVEWLMTSMKYLGAGYLIYLGYLLLSSSKKSDQSGDGGGSSFIQEQNLGKQFLLGFMSGILNPKNAIFYLSLFTVIVSEQTGVVSRTLYALWMTSVVFLWDALVATILCRDQLKQYLGRGVFYVEKVSGVMLFVFGILLPFT